MGARRAGATDAEIDAALAWIMAIRAGMAQSLFRRAEVRGKREGGA